MVAITFACLAIMFAVTGVATSKMGENVAKHFKGHLNKHDEQHMVAGGIACLAISYFCYFCSIVFIITSVIFYAIGI